MAILNRVAQSMGFEEQPVSIQRLESLLKLKT
jgi:hypothetical protein